MLGLLVGASAREQTRQVSRLRQYIEAEQKPDNDYSFDGLGDLDRTISSVEIAASQLNLNEDKMMAALFWFYNGNKITDEPAFDALKEFDLDQCTAIWEKLISNGEVTARNASAFNNLGTIYLIGLFNGTDTNEEIIKKGLTLKLQFLESDFTSDFKLLATDETYNADKKELQLLFLNNLQKENEDSKFLTVNEFLEIVNQLKFSAKTEYLKRYIQLPIENIERKILEVENKTKTNKAKAGDYGNELYNATKDDFALVKSILLNSDIKLTNIADKLAEALLDCSIAVFNHFHETETEVGEIALDLNKKAKIIARSNRVIARIDESIPIVQSYVNGKTKRQATLKTKVELEKIILILQKNDNNEYLEMGLGSINAARTMITECKPYLNKMKQNVGQTDETFMMISTGVASKALGYIIAEVNLSTNENSVKNALSLIDLINTLDSTYDFKVNRLAPNKATLENMLPKSGCYIATMAYGDYDHPQVMILREFRDDVLGKTVLGKWFIKTYYNFSPKLVEMLKNQKTVNNLIRKLLNLLIKLIKS